MLRKLLVLTFVLAGCKSESGPAAPASAPAAAPAPAAPTPAPAPAATLLPVGAPAPDVTGKTFDGKEVSLAALRGKPVVLYFYPKDFTGGCTLEAQSFRDDSTDLAAQGATVIGVSKDSLDSHQKFSASEHLNFPLLSDTDGAIAAKFGVDTSHGYAARTTFVIDKDGKIAKVFPDVQVPGHAAAVLAAVREVASAK